jgi:hypothetical protein
MAQDKRQVDPKFRPEDEIDELFASANPNPNRIGCPTLPELKELAKRARPIDEPLYSHLTECSPCYQQFRALQAPTHKSSSWRTYAAIAAVLACFAVGLALWRQPEAIKTPDRPEVAQMARAEFDLRGYSPIRSDNENSALAPLRMNRSEMLAELILPVGLEAGVYEVRLLDTGLQSKVQTTGNAEIRNGQNRLSVRLDLRALPPGTYELRLRRDGESWKLFPTRVE